MTMLPQTVRQGLKRIPGIRRTVGWLRPGIRRTVGWLGSRTYKFYCPVCSQRVAKFHPLGKFYAENQQRHGWPYKPEDAETINAAQYSCPECDASDRDRLYALFLNRQLPADLTGGDRELLEFAPGKALSRFIGAFRGIRYRTADLFMEGVDDQIDIMDMKQYAVGRFDIFICSHVLEHVADDRKALAELFRILRPGGWGILMAPINLVAKGIDEEPTVTDEGERWRRFGQNDHVRLYTKAGFIERARQAGFILHQYGVDYFGNKVFQRCGITSQSVLYVAEKSATAASSPAPGGAS